MTTIPALPPTSVTLLSADEFVAQYSRQRVELDKGRIQVLPMPGAYHGQVYALLARLIGNHVAEHNLGRVMSNDTFIQTLAKPDSVRGADLLFVSYDRLPRDARVPDGVLRVAPELVVEVRSPSDRWPDTIIKVGEYLNMGVKLIVVLDMPTASASLFRDQDHWCQHLDNGDEMDLSEVLPGFRVPVRRLFEE
jgi:Uma2 family endonuclease